MPRIGIAVSNSKCVSNSIRNCHIPCVVVLYMLPVGLYGSSTCSPCPPTCWYFSLYAVSPLKQVSFCKPVLYKNPVCWSDSLASVLFSFLGINYTITSLAFLTISLGHVREITSPWVSILTFLRMHSRLPLNTS